MQINNSMKKQLKITRQFLVLLLLPALVITSCSKKSDSTPEENQQTMIKGTWKQTTGKYEYYDAKGTKIYEQTVDLGTLTFDGNTTVTSTIGGDTEKASYAFSKEGSTNFLTFTSGTDISKYTLVSLSNTSMSLSIETLNDFYYTGTTVKTAAKSVLSSTLVKN